MSSLAPRAGMGLVKTPSHRQQVQRRWQLAACAAIGLALASGLIGALTAPVGESAARIITGPFSYFPPE